MERVQCTQDGHDLLGQRAAVRGCQRHLWAGLPPAQGTFCGPKDAYHIFLSQFTYRSLCVCVCITVGFYCNHRESWAETVEKERDTGGGAYNISSHSNEIESVQRSWPVFLFLQKCVREGSADVLYL